MTIYNTKTKQKIPITTSMIQTYGSPTDFIKSISLFEYQPDNWIIDTENNLNYFLYVESIDVDRYIKYAAKKKHTDIIETIKKLNFRINDPCGPLQYRTLENVKLKVILNHLQLLIKLNK